MKPWEFKNWQAWEGTAHILLSDQSNADLTYHKNTDDVVNYLYLTGNKEAARSLNAHLKANA